MKKLFASVIALSISTISIATVTVTKTVSGRLFDDQSVQYMPGVGLHSSNAFIPLKLDSNGAVQTTSSDSAISLVSTQTVSPSQSAVYIDTGDGVQVKSAPLMGITGTGTFVPILVDGSGKLITSGGASGDITSVVAGTALTGGGTSGDVTLNADVGTTANKLVQLNGSAQIPAVSGALLTNLNGSNIASGTVPTARLDVGTSANQIVQLNGSGQLPAVSGALLTNLASPTDVATVIEDTYDFSVNGGAISDITLTKTLPTNTFVSRVYFVGLTSVTSGGNPDIGLKIGSTAVVSGLTKGDLNSTALVEGTFGIPTRTASGGAVKLSISTATITAGKFRIHIEYRSFTP